MSNIDLRPARPADFQAITDIYAYNVLHGTGTFALEPPPESEMRAKWLEVSEMGLPYIVALLDGKIAGYAYASPFRARPGYRYGVEDSLYVGQEFQGKGIGKAMLERLINDCTRRNFYTMIAVIGDGENAASIGVHKSCGFEVTGTLPCSGYKFGRWLDVVFMTRTLRPKENPPIGDGWMT
jgi:L-amino acid N-acyltransferase YncA